MDTFSLQRSVIRTLVQQRPSLSQGVAIAHSLVATKPHGSLWAQCVRPAHFWNALESRWIEWIDNLVSRHPTPDPTQLLWFEWPSELNPALTSVSGFATLDQSDDTFGMEAGRNWPETKDGTTRVEALLDLPEIDDCFSASGWDPHRFDPLREKLERGFFAMSAAVVTLLVLNGLPRSKISAQMASERLGVVCGSAEGDSIPIGILRQGAWAPLKSLRKRMPPSKEELDPASYMFRLDKYLANGGDPNWRDKKTGRSLLMNHSFRDVRTLLRAGADPTLSDRRGYPTLHVFGAAAISILNELVKAGAKPKVKTANGYSFLQLISFDGRCTQKHLDWCWRRGIRFGRPPKPFQPVHHIAVSGIYERGRDKQLREMAKWWLRRGFGLDEIDSARNTPLARAIDAHATELDEYLELIAENGELGGHWDSQHDRVAEMLLELGANPNVRISRPSSKRLVRDATPLMVQRYDDDRLVQALLKHGADPTLKSSEGKTALDYARAASTVAKRGNEAAARVASLLERALKRRHQPSTPKSQRSRSR